MDSTPYNQELKKTGSEVYIHERRDKLIRTDKKIWMNENMEVTNHDEES